MKQKSKHSDLRRNYGVLHPFVCICFIIISFLFMFLTLFWNLKVVLFQSGLLAFQHMATVFYICSLTRHKFYGMLPNKWLIIVTIVAAISTSIYLFVTGVVLFSKCKAAEINLIALYQQLCYHEKGEYLALFILLLIVLLFDVIIIIVKSIIYKRNITKKEHHIKMTNIQHQQQQQQKGLTIFRSKIES
jgi:hypothetical protein